MIPELRNKFIKEFSEDRYRKFLSEMWKPTGGIEDFRICETPLFLDETLTDSLVLASSQITDFLQTQQFIELSGNAVPESLSVPNEDSHPLFLQIDFAISADTEGNYIPYLIELQGFPSLYAFQCELDKTNRKFYDIPENMTSYFNGLNFNSYIELLRKNIVGDHAPENVILLEIEPDKQKTRIDFHFTREFLGVEPVCVTRIYKSGRGLFYRNNGKEIRVERIYNRVIFDELLRKNLQLNFDFRDDLDVEWAGHPNWFFKLSKYTLPLIKNEFSPVCFYLNELETYPDNLKDFVLKPLYSFAGSGVNVDIDKVSLDKIWDRQNYILQKKVDYALVIKTPDGYSKAEIRMMFVWDEKPLLVNNLLRTSRGKMMGVDFNKGLKWVGSNIAYHF